MLRIYSLLPPLTPTNVQIEFLRKNTERLISIIREKFSEEPYNVNISCEGSFEKETFLYPCDIDLFISTSESYFENLVQKLLSLKKTFRQSRIKYSKHPYLQITFEAINFDVVPIITPVLGLTSTSFNITPLHTLFIKQNLNLEQREDVRVLKYLLKLSGLYSSPLLSGGFTGMLCEMLIFNNNTLEALLRYLISFEGPLICYDPVASSRNLGDSVSLRNMYKVKVFADLILNSPEEFLRDPLPPVDSLFYMVEAELPRYFEKVLETQTFKICNRLLEAENLTILNVTPLKDLSKIYFIVETVIPDLRIINLNRGPLLQKAGNERYQRFLRNGFRYKFTNEGVYKITSINHYSFEEALSNLLNSVLTKFTFTNIHRVSPDERIKNNSRIEWCIRTL